MKTRRFPACVGCLAAVLVMSLAGCSQGGGGKSAAPSNASGPVATTPVATEGEEAAIIAVIQANVDASNNEDVAVYMACLDPSSLSYGSTQTQITNLYARYDLHVELNETSVVDVSATVAHVRVVMTTTKITGPAFRDNRLTAVMELHKVNGGWKIYGQTIINTEYL
jgi:ketosteroid isomerase-like protein